jgi:hypothetical protein
MFTFPGKVYRKALKISVESLSVYQNELIILSCNNHFKINLIFSFPKSIGKPWWFGKPQ